MDGNEVLPQDTTHRMQRPCYQRGSPCQDPAGNRTTRRLPDDRKETQTAVGMVMSPVHQVWPKPSCKAHWKGEEDKADRGRDGKTTSGNGQAWSSAGPRGQWRTGQNGVNWLRNRSVVAQRPSWLRDRWWWWWWLGGTDRYEWSGCGSLFCRFSLWVYLPLFIYLLLHDSVNWKGGN